MALYQRTVRRRRRRRRRANMRQAIPKTARIVRERKKIPRKRPRFRQENGIFWRARLRRGLRRRRYSLKARSRIIFGALRALKMRRRRES